ncbi:hypothetical protein QMK19_03230 [Streptomyces sp. H10-C2]|uniref:3'-5' exonuclease n=1 Tax=unclassified Streptomyces TaxID=2593676 RepID=UPI0024B93A5E|nr:MULTISPECIES: hypothetical protein [unclassified Streptomyces]MDJ0342198.1 hypothetical protein [Streptomyces sp. PH10-H1]MDJ0368712.1 hypothetical protein [Streptomyces sp. H10-C2]
MSTSSPPKTPWPLASTDIETTGLDPIRHSPWEIAVIRRETDGTENRHLWQLRLTDHELRIAEPKALEISRYHERIAVPEGADAADMTPTLQGGAPLPLDWADAAQQVWHALDGAVMIGSNAHFDASFLHRYLSMGRDPWHYRPVCVATMAAGYKHAMRNTLRAAGGEVRESDDPGMPFSSRDLSRWMGVEPPGPDTAHTAMADAEWALALHDAITGGGR